MTDIAALEYKRLVVGGDRFVLNREHCTPSDLTNQEQIGTNIRQRRRSEPVVGDTEKTTRRSSPRGGASAEPDASRSVAGGAGDFTDHPPSPPEGVLNGAPSVLPSPRCRHELPPRRRFTRSEHVMSHPLDEQDSQADPASLTLSGLRESVVHLNEDSSDGTFDMLARAIASNRRRMREIEDIFRLRLSERRCQRLAERSAQ